MTEKEIQNMLQSLDELHIYNPELKVLTFEEYEEYLTKLEEADD